MKLKNFTAFLLIALLSACGGSSETPQSPPATGGGSGGGSGGGNPTNITVTAKAAKTSICGGTFATSDATLVIYDANWSEINRYQADGNGLMTAEVPSNLPLNFSVITRSNVDGTKSVSINSAAQHPKGFLGTFFTPIGVETGCECKQTQVNLVSEQGNINTNINLAGGINITAAEQVSASQVKLSSVQICRQENQAWPVLSATANTGAAMLAGQLAQYDPEQTLQINLTQTPSLFNVQVDPEAQRVSQFHKFNDNVTSLFSDLTIPYSQFIAFPQLQGLQRLSIFASNENQTTQDNKSIFESRTAYQSRALPVNQLTVNLPPQDTINLLQQFNETLNGEVITYNLENNSGMFLLSKVESVMLKNGEQYNYQHLGPIKGILPPNLISKELNYENDEVLISYLQLMLSNNSAYTDYDTFMLNRASMASQQPTEITIQESMMIISNTNF